jgi:predicted  nucleic acid-binding Zn-ribbon protein
MLMDWNIVLQAAGALGGIAVLTLPWQIRKMKADTGKTSADSAAVLTENALKMLEPAKQEMGWLEDRLNAARSRVTDLEEALKESQAEVQDLRNQVTAMTKEVIELRTENLTLKGMR